MYLRSSYTVASWPGLESSITVMEKRTWERPAAKDWSRLMKMVNLLYISMDVRFRKRSRACPVVDNTEGINNIPAVPEPADIVERQQPQEAQDGGEDACDGRCLCTLV